MSGKEEKMGSIKTAMRKLDTKFSDLRRKLLDDRKKFVNEWAEKFNTHIKNYDSFRASFQQVFTALSQQLITHLTTQEVHSNAIEHLDIRGMIHGKMIEGLFDRMAQVDYFFRTLEVKPEDLTPEALAEVRAEAREVYLETYARCKALTLEERAAELQKRREEAQKKQMEELAKAEEDMAETALQEAESSSTLSSEPGGQGSPIPEGAEVFGG